MKRVLLSWSSGKDSAWALHILRQQPDIEFVGLLTTLNSEFQRVAMHGTRRSVLEAQSAAASLPLWVVPLPWPCPNEIYEQLMAEVCQRAVAEHIDAVAFGDLFLPDVRAYREKQLKPTGLEPLFPLWQIPTDELARTMISGGLRAQTGLHRYQPTPRILRRPRIRRQPARRLSPRNRPLRRARRVPHLRLRRPHVQSPAHLQPGEVVNREGFVFADFQ